MKDFLISCFVGLIITGLMSPYVTIVKNFQVAQGMNLFLVERNWGIFLAACTLGIGLMVDMVISIVKFVLNLC